VRIKIPKFEAFPTTCSSPIVLAIVLKREINIKGVTFLILPTKKTHKGVT